MATTVVMPPTNTITLAQKYLPILDEVYKRESLTSMFDTAQAEFVGANTVQLFNYDSVGMANYSRDAGYVMGNITAGWEDYTITQDRGRAFQIDAMSNEETLGMTLASALSEEERVHIIPEVDAYRFSKWAGTTGVSSATGTITVGTTNVADLIATAEAQMDNDEVPYEGRVLYVSPVAYQALKGNIERRIINSENNVNMNVEYFDDMQVIRVPQGRFVDAITLNAPTTAAGQGGYTASGNNINFMIVHPSAIMQVMKHRVLRVFNPNENIEADAFRVNLRYYHDTWVKDNKVKGIYVHAEA